MCIFVYYLHLSDWYDRPEIKCTNGRHLWAIIFVVVHCFKWKREQTFRWLLNVSWWCSQWLQFTSPQLAWSLLSISVLFCAILIIIQSSQFFFSRYMIRHFEPKGILIIFLLPQAFQTHAEYILHNNSWMGTLTQNNRTIIR